MTWCFDTGFLLPGHALSWRHWRSPQMLLDVLLKTVSKAWSSGVVFYRGFDSWWEWGYSGKTGGMGTPWNAMPMGVWWTEGRVFATLPGISIVTWLISTFNRLIQSMIILHPKHLVFLFSGYELLVGTLYNWNLATWIGGILVTLKLRRGVS